MLPFAYLNDPSIFPSFVAEVAYFNGTGTQRVL